MSARHFLSPLASAILALTIALPAYGQQEVTVTTLADDESAGSLRNILENATSGAETFITFAPNLAGGTITLTSGQLEVPTGTEVSINASTLTDGITIDANQGSRVMEINPNATVTLHSLTLTGGDVTDGLAPDNFGGAIYANGSGLGNSVSLSLIACTISGNSANSGGGIYSDSFNGGTSSLTLSTCTISSNSATGGGGGLFGDGSTSGNSNISLSACTISGNSADGGGGIFSTGLNDGNANLSLDSCTISGNFAGFAGGGINSEGRMDGNTSVSLDGCTISNNSASFLGGGLFSFAGSDDDLGITNTEVINSILAGNTAPTTPDLGNLGDNSNMTAGGNNLLNQNSPIDPMLAPLGDNGGPTMTMLPLAGSPAIDMASAPTRATDQRGFIITDGSPDIGAVELSGVNQTELFALLWDTDNDNDGNSFGLELVFGTDPFIADSGNPRNLTGNFNNTINAFELRFGQNSALPDGITVSIQRSSGLQPSSFTEIASYNSTDDTFTTTESDTFEVDGLPSDLFFRFLDSRSPARAFYRLETSFEAP